MIRKFRKKPIIIDALQYDGDNWLEISEFVGPDELLVDIASDKLTLSTLEGDMLLKGGDWVIKGVKGEFYPCKPDIFELTYTQEEEE